MRVLYILHETSPDKGSWKAAIPLLRGLRRNGVELSVVVPDSKGIYGLLKDEGFTVVAARYFWNNTKKKATARQIIEWLPRTLRRKFYAVSWLSKMKRYCREFRPDIIHSNSSVIVNGYKLAECMGIPHVWHVREYGDLDFDLRLSESGKLMKKNRYFICITRGVRQHRNLASNPDARVIYDGVCGDSVTAPGFPKEDCFLYVGALSENKGIKDLLDTWKRFKSDNRNHKYVLKVCGGSDETVGIWKSYAESIGIRDSVQWLGMRKNVTEFMIRAKAVVVPSKFEGFGLVMPEALSVGTLVIGRNTGGTKEQFDNGLRLTGEEIGVRFDSNDELLQALQDVADGKTDARGMIERGQKALLEFYSIGSSVGSVFNFYGEIMKSRSLLSRDR